MTVYKSILSILPPHRAVAYTAERLREQADAEVWGTQEAVSKWLRILAEDLDEIAAALTPERRP